ncbi:MAG: hypothetical protein RQ866_00770, partial [Bacteroidales bacterium]|nr:hypothetical protein [Bacteroidales bacterium]
MKKFISTSITLFAVMMVFSFSGIVNAQTMMPLPPHSSTYTGIYARGYWFIAPTDFTITGLKVAPEAGAGLQYIHVMKCLDQFPISTSGSTNFLTLSYTSGSPNNTIVPVNIQVQQGDQIGILGTVTGISNSYAASQAVTSTIGTHSVFLNRLGYQGSIESGPAPNYWGVVNGGSGSIGRVFMYYTIAGPTDAGLETFVFPQDTICEGNQ